MRMTHAAIGTAKKNDSVTSKNPSTAVKVKGQAMVSSETNTTTKKRTVKTRTSAAATEDHIDHDTVEVDDDRPLHRHHHHHSTIWESLTTCLTASGWLNLLADSMHNFTDGIALGASFAASKGLGTAALLSVLFHEIPHELSDFTILVESGLSKWEAIQAQFLTAIAAFLGTPRILLH